MLLSMFRSMEHSVTSQPSGTSLAGKRFKMTLVRPCVLPPVSVACAGAESYTQIFQMCRAMAAVESRIENAPIRTEGPTTTFLRAEAEFIRLL